LSGSRLSPRASASAARRSRRWSPISSRSSMEASTSSGWRCFFVTRKSCAAAYSEGSTGAWRLFKALRIAAEWFSNHSSAAGTAGLARPPSRRAAGAAQLPPLPRTAMTRRSTDVLLLRRLLALLVVDGLVGGLTSRARKEGAGPWHAHSAAHSMTAFDDGSLDDEEAVAALGLAAGTAFATPTAVAPGRRSVFRSWLISSLRKRPFQGRQHVGRHWRPIAWRLRHRARWKGGAGVQTGHVLVEQQRKRKEGSVRPGATVVRNPLTRRQSS